MVAYLKARSWIANLLALVGGLGYFIQSWMYVHMQTTVVDEGGFLYGGYLLAKGIYHPYQSYGIWMYNPPLVYLIPGYVQRLFGSGLRTGRYLVVLLGMLMVFALWITARRVGGKWWASAVVLAVALMPIQIRIYSTVASEVLVACIFSWALMFILGENRTLWHIIIGSVLTSMLVMTRHNMIFILPVVIGYIFWQHGKEKGWLALCVNILFISITHLIYWPDILKIWATDWMPIKLYFLRAFRPPSGELMAMSWNQKSNLLTKLLSLSIAFRSLFISLVGAITALILWPYRHKWKDQASFRSAVFLAVLFFTLLVSHVGAALLSNINTFSITPYITFFSPAALLLIVVSAESWESKPPIWAQATAVIFILIAALGVGYALTEDKNIGGLLLNIPIPLVTHLLRGEWPPSPPLWIILMNKFHIQHDISLKYASPLAGFVCGMLLLCIVYFAKRLFTRKKILLAYPVAFLALISFLLSGYILSPLMNGEFRQNGTCSQDIILANEDAGKFLENIIPEKSNVYFDLDSAIPMLYLEDVKIYPPQIYNDASYRKNEDSDSLLAYGFWNDELAAHWMRTADVLIINEYRFNTRDRYQSLDLSQYDKSTGPSVDPCHEGYKLIILRKK